MADAVDDDGEERYWIESNQAYVACATSACLQCGADILVIAIYCATATLDGDPFDDCSVINITAANEALEAQLALWPFFRKRKAVFCNVCPHCNTPQADIELHCQPNGVFFRMDAASRAMMTVTRLAGTVRLSGEETVG
jgi:hypothetical protein